MTVRSQRPAGFTVLEVLVAMSILTIMLLALYQAFSTSLFIITSTQNLWRAMTFSQNELLKWERSPISNISIDQGEFKEDHPLFGFRWTQEISDETVLGYTIRKVSYKLLWQEGQHEYSHTAEIYIKPN